MPRFATLLYSYLCFFLKPLPQSALPLAFTYAKTCFAKTKTSSHLSFLRTCIRHHIIPIGFRLRHSPSDKSNSTLLRQTSALLHKTSYQLMNTHIRDLSRKLSQQDKLLETINNQLFHLLGPVTQLYLKITVSNLNAALYRHINNIKQNKFNRLKLDSATNVPFSGMRKPSDTSNIGLPSTSSSGAPITTTLVSDVLEVTASMTSDNSTDHVFPTKGSNNDTSFPTSPAPLMSEVPKVTTSTTSDNSTALEIPAKGSNDDIGSGTSPTVHGDASFTCGNVAPIVHSDTVASLGSDACPDTYPRNSSIVHDKTIGSQGSESAPDTNCGNSSIVREDATGSRGNDVTHSPDTHRPTSSTLNQLPSKTDNQLVFCIPSTLPLTEAEISVLSKGLKFIPLKPSCNKFDIIQDCERFFRSLRWMAVFDHPPRRQFEPHDDDFTKLFKQPSYREPPHDNPEVEVYIHKCTKELKNLQLKPCRKSNLSSNEWIAIRSLQKRDDIVIKPADKGGAIVVWDRNLYIQEAMSQLNKQESYRVVTKHSLTKDKRQISLVINNLIKSGQLPLTARKLLKHQPREAVFYLLPKIHKINHPGRPIVSACSCPTEHISLYLDSILQPLVETLPTYIKDSTHALNLIESLNNQNIPITSLFTVDVTSLYTNIPHADGLKALSFYLEKRHSKEPPTESLIRLAELVLTLNTFSFNDTVFNQMSGVAMGTKMGPSYACLFMGYLEHQICQQYRKPLPEFYRRFIDDGLGASSLPKQQLLDFISFIQDFHPAIKYTFEISSNSVTFLDIKLTLENGRINTSVHYKTTDSHSYLDYRSSHTTSTKDSIPYSQFLRLRRLCSNDDDFDSKAVEMSDFFRARHYPEDVINEALRKAQSTSRIQALKPTGEKNNSDRPIVTLLYHPTVNKVRKILLSNWPILQAHPKTANTFSAPPLIAYKRDTNLKDLLVRTKLSNRNKQTKCAGTHACGSPKCVTCPFICGDVRIHTDSFKFQVRKHFTCRTTNMVYVISCTTCNKRYIGETGRTLDDRIREHLKDIQYNRDNKTVARHFNQPGHSVQNLRVQGMWLMRTDCAKQRKDTESYWIRKLNTFHPFGLNEKF